MLLEHLLKKEGIKETISFYHDTNDGFNRKTPSDKVLPGKVLNIAKNLKCYWYQRRLAAEVYKRPLLVVVWKMKSYKSKN